MTQQTALDFYIDKMNEWFKDACAHCGLRKEDNEIYQQAKAIEKEQIIEAWDKACTDQDRIGKEYYSDTYEGNN